MTRLAINFIVLGAEEKVVAGLRATLSAQPGIWMPVVPVEPFFGDDERFGRGVEWFSEEVLEPPRSARTIGLFGPEYMAGTADAGSQLIASRVASALPDVLFVALLSDPIARAVSLYYESVPEGPDEGSVEEVARELLDPARLEAARWGEPGEGRCVVDGEYGRILASYAAHFPSDRFLVGFWEEFELRPAELVTRILGFLGVGDPADGVDPEQPVGGGVNAGGPTEEPAGLPASVRMELERFYRRDLETLVEVFDVDVPWAWASEG